MSDADENAFENFGQMELGEGMDDPTASSTTRFTTIPADGQATGSNSHFLAAMSVARQIRGGRTKELVTAWAYHMNKALGGRG